MALLQSGRDQSLGPQIPVGVECHPVSAFGESRARGGFLPELGRHNLAAYVARSGALAHWKCELEGFDGTLRILKLRGTADALWLGLGSARTEFHFPVLDWLNLEDEGRLEQDAMRWMWELAPPSGARHYRHSDKGSRVVKVGALDLSELPAAIDCPATVLRRGTIELTGQLIQAIDSLLAERPDYVRQMGVIRGRTQFVDEFGDPDERKWATALRDFMHRKVSPLVNPLMGNRAYLVREALPLMVQASLEAAWDTGGSSPGSMNWTGGSAEEFEQYCATVLRALEFSVMATSGGADQGADLIARKGSTSVAVQCKRYKGTVGNAAVQEVVAAQAYYGCSSALVVATGRFSTAARQLAAANGVMTLTAEELSRGALLDLL